MNDKDNMDPLSDNERRIFDAVADSDNMADLRTWKLHKRWSVIFLASVAIYFAVVPGIAFWLADWTIAFVGLGLLLASLMVCLIGIVVTMPRVPRRQEKR